MNKAAVIVAGGSGSRMGSSRPKQYLDLSGKPVIQHTIERFFAFDASMRVVVVIASEHLDYWKNISEMFPGIITTSGGPSRYYSVQNGLAKIPSGSVVGVHDAARPLVSRSLLARCYETAIKQGSAIPVLEVEDTIRRVISKGHSEPEDRTTLRRVQTPQVFHADLLRKAYEQSVRPDFTDDASVFEAAHGKLYLVEGDPSNVKITWPVDLRLARLLMDSHR